MKLTKDSAPAIAVAFVGALAMLVFALPAIEESQDTLVGESLITKTCRDRHGYDVIRRWSCRSSLNRAGVAAIVTACAFKNKDRSDRSDLCTNYDRVMEDDKRSRAKK